MSGPKLGHLEPGRDLGEQDGCRQEEILSAGISDITLRRILGGGETLEVSRTAHESAAEHQAT